MDALPECMRTGVVTFIPSVVVYSIPWVVIFSTVPNRIGISWRESARQLSQTSRVGVGIEIVSAVCSVVSCILYVYQSYDEASNSFFGWTYILEVSFSTSFMVYWAANLAISREPLKYIITLQSLLDLCTSLPTIVTMLSGLCTDSSVTSFLAVARVLKFLRVFRLLRVVRSMELLSDAADDAIHRQTMRLISTIVVILVISTGFVQFLANELGEEWLGVAQRCHFESQDLCYSVCPRQSLAEDVCASVSKDGIESFECIFRRLNYRGPGAQCKNLMEFHDSLYYTIVTFGTVGYGDVAPVDDVSRISMIFLIGLAIWAVPSQINALNQLRDLRSDFDRSFVKSPDRAHCIVSCDAAVDLVRFVAEFFHEDHQQIFSSTPQLILLINKMPDADLCTLLLKYASKQRIVFIRGDASNPTDLGRARVDVADAIFFLANVQARDHDIEDMMMVRRALTARRVNPHIKVYARLLKPHNQHLLLATGVRRKDVVCHDQMRLSLLGNACVSPGIPALVLNLGKSISWRQSMSVTSWHDEYCEGMVNEVYDLRIRADLVGITFGELGRQIKDAANGTLIAVARVSGGQVMERATFDPSGRLLIRRARGQATSRVAASDPSGAEERMLGVLCNPGMDYEIGENDVVFVIADEMKRLESFERPWHGTEVAISKSPFTWLANFLVSRLCPQFLNIEAAQEFRNLQESAREQEQIRTKSQKDLATNRRVSVASVHAEDELDRMERVPSASEVDGYDHGVIDSIESASFPPDDDHTMSGGGKSGVGATPANMTSMFQGRGRAVDSTVYGNVPGAERVKTCMDEMVDCFANEFEQDGDKFTGHIRAFACDMIARVRPADIDSSGDAVSRSLFEAVIHCIPDDIRGHIICVSQSLSDMEFFLNAIHSPNREEIPAVVFVTNTLPNLKEWREIRIFPKVYIIISDDEGNPRDAFLRAGILTAKTTIVVGSDHIGESGSADSTVMANMLDAHWISMVNPDLELISELNQGGFARKVANGLSQGRSGEGDLMNAIDSMNLMEGYQHLESSYMAGHSVKTEMLDCLVCMQYYNPYIISIMQQLLLGYSASDKDAQSTEIVGGYGKDSVIQYHKLPEDFAGRSFGELFEAMMREEDSIVIGLYRKVEDSGESQGSQSYVYTNPKSSTVLRESDHFYSIESHPIASTATANAYAASHRDGAGPGGGGSATTSNQPATINSTEHEGGSGDVIKLGSNADRRLDMVSELHEDQGQDGGDHSLKAGANQASPGRWDDEAVTSVPLSDDVGWSGSQRHEGGSQGKEVESSGGTPR